MLSKESEEYLEQLAARDAMERVAGPLPAEADRIRQTLFDAVSHNIVKDGSLMIACFIFLQSGHVVPLVFSGGADSSKEGFVDQIQMLALAFEVVCVAVVGEAWLADPRGVEEEVAKRGISQLESRQEIVHIGVEWADTGAIWIYGIERDKDGKVVGLNDKAMFSHLNGEPRFQKGLFSNLMPISPVPADLRRVVRASLPDGFKSLLEHEMAMEEKSSGHVH